MVQLVTIAVTTTQKNKIKKAAQAYAKSQKKPLSTYFRELKQKLPKSECGGNLPGGQQHYLIKTTHALRKQVIKHDAGARVKVGGKMVSCYTCKMGDDYMTSQSGEPFNLF